jgi:competence protein ComEC
MRLNIAAFVVGIILLQQQAALPPLSWIGVLPLAATAFWLPREGGPVRHLRQVLVFAFFLAAGLLWAAWRADVRLADALPHNWEGRDVDVTGIVAGLPEATATGLRFVFEPDAVLTPGAVLPGRIQLARRDIAFGTNHPLPHAGTPVAPGERWRFTVRLQRPHGLANPHGFDAEAHWLAENIRATGHIVRPETATRLDAFVPRPGLMVERIRHRADRVIAESLAGRPYAGVIRALAVGNQSAIPDSQWTLFRQTGVVHLMSISGLHVTLLGSMAFGLTLFLWRRWSWGAVRLPARKAAVLAGAALALVYALLAGFGVPAQRTLYMLAVMAAALWLDRTGSPSKVLALAALAVVLIDPWAVLAPGFWLSFGAVAAIFFAHAHRRQRAHWTRAWLSTQWAVTLALIPGLLLLFREVSLVSPLANLIAIPLVSLGVIPLAIAGGLTGLAPLLDVAHGLMDLCAGLLAWLASLPGALWRQHEPPLWAAGLGLLGVLWLLLPRGLPARGLGAVLIAPLFLARPESLPEGAFGADVLDVGQGLAVLVRTQDHALLFDAGPDYSGETDAGGRVVLPHLVAEGVTRLDAVILSHDDNDHTGGAASVMWGLPPGQLLTSLANAHPLLAGAHHRRCAPGVVWDWNGVRFEILHPTPVFQESSKLGDNDKGCVLKVSSSYGNLLIPADIERLGELSLIERMPKMLPADVLIAPHHGSLTSSTPDFVAKVHPRAVVFTAGHRNRFGHPRPEVVRRYRDAGSRIHRTDRDGAVLLRFGPEGVKMTPWREARKRYWQE